MRAQETIVGVRSDHVAPVCGACSISALYRLLVKERRMGAHRHEPGSRQLR